MPLKQRKLWLRNKKETQNNIGTIEQNDELTNEKIKWSDARAKKFVGNICLFEGWNNCSKK